jgi:hypothetical protein
MISDERVGMQDLEEGADRIIKVSLKKGISQINIQ